jgi:hypothetical protein
MEKSELARVLLGFSQSAVGPSSDFGPAVCKTTRRIEVTGFQAETAQKGPVSGFFRLHRPCSGICKTTQRDHKELSWIGTGGGARTPTSVKTPDFESSASANSATPATGTGAQYSPARFDVNQFVHSGAVGSEEFEQIEVGGASAVTLLPRNSFQFKVLQATGGQQHGREQQNGTYRNQ